MEPPELLILIKFARGLSGNREITPTEGGAASGLTHSFWGGRQRRHLFLRADFMWRCESFGSTGRPDVVKMKTRHAC